MENSKTPLSIALAENARLLEENARSKKLLAVRGLRHPTDNRRAVNRPGPQVPGPQLPLASIQDWDALKGVQRKTRKLLPLTDEAIRNHLTGIQTIGIYPLLEDGCCWFMAVDFDKASWQEDCIEFLFSVRFCNEGPLR